MSQGFKDYRKLAREATRDLLCCHPKDFVDSYIKRINKTKNDVQISQIMAEVRNVM